LAQSRITVEVGLHVREPLHDRVDAVAEARACQIRVHHLHLALLTFLSLAAAGEVDQRVPEHDR
jgi:hypothetical protein